MKSEISLALSKELLADTLTPPADLGLRAGTDVLHPLYRSQVVTSFATWNVLDLCDHKEVRVAAIKALEEYGAGSMAGRFVGGLSTIHSACEARIAGFFGAESALLFSTKNQAILTLITALSSEGLVVIGPTLSPLPLADACALVEVDYAEFEGTESLRSTLERYRTAKRVIVVAETLAATTGKRAELSQLLLLAEQSGAWVVLDESTAVAHSGLRGAGSAEEVPSSPALLARVCSCGALIGAEMSAIAGPSELRELLVQRSRYVRVEPLPAAAVVAATTRAIDIVELSITHRDRLLVRSKMVQAAIRAQGWSVVSEDDVPIIAMWCDTLGKARELQEGLLQRGLVTEALAARGIRKNGAVVRAIVSTGHTDLEVARLLDSLLEIRKRIGA